VKSDNWETLETVYARIKTMGGGEVVRADQKEALFTHEVETRYRANFGGSLGMLPRFRILFGSKVFTIQSVIHPYSGSDKTVLRVREVVT